MFDAYIDNSGILQEEYREIKQVGSFMYVMCTRGECSVTSYTFEHTLTANSIITLLPNSYFRINSQNPDTELYVVSFKRATVSSPNLFARIMKNITLVIEFPVLVFDPSTVAIICEYTKMLMLIKTDPSISENSEFISTTFTQFAIILGIKYNIIETENFKLDRSRVLVWQLLKLITSHYREERGAIFYADKMHVSPQHLSSVVKRVTNRTITDLIATIVIIDAQTQLVTSDLSIGEIAAYLNFNDISVFGRYFKRYTKVSPQQYRKQ